MLKRFLVILVVFVLAVSVVGTAFADDDGPADTAHTDASAPQEGGIGGVVPVRSANAPSNFLGGGNLTYHGGPVMRTTKVYTIFWVPAGYSVSATYRSIINRYFIDVAAASGVHSNVYYSLTQYYSLPGPLYITNTSTFGGTYNDAQPFPANGCSLYSGVTKCLSDTQIRNEVKRVVALKGWVANSTSMFFMFTPNGVGSCYNASSCAFTQYCAYHSYTGAVTYANQPYTYTKPAACGVSKSPNHDFAADSTINVASHEHREAINDYHLNAWYDSAGYEGSDKCAWIFGSLAAGYNQTINGHHYVLQEEWSNLTSKCVLSGK